MIAKTEKDKEMLRAAGKMLAGVLQDTASRARVGVTAAELNTFAEEQIRALGCVPVFLNYTEDGAPPYPATLCVSINDEVVHGIPTAEKIIKAGDVVSLDLGLSHEGYVVDAAVTVIVGSPDGDNERLVEGTREALHAGIATLRAGSYIGDIGAAVAAVAKKYNLAVVRDLGGHGVGEELHEAPFIANFGTEGQGEKIAEGSVLALEPIFTLDSGAIRLDQKDGWTYKTRDGSYAAHFEHTVLVTEKGAEVLTQLQ